MSRREAPGRTPGPDAQRTRRVLLLTFFVLAAVLVLGRAFQLQALEGEKWAREADEQHRDRVPLPARRGGIFDRDGVPLALTQETFRISIAPNELRDRSQAVDRLVKVLGLSPADARRATSPKRRWVVLPGRYGADQRERLAGVRGFHFERRLERFYPHGEVGRGIVGTVAGDGRALGGMEQQFDALLQGEDGYAVIRKDARGRSLSAFSLPVVAPRDGADLVLTIDFDLQEIADGALREAIRSTGASGGDLLIADPRTGEVLAAVSRRPRGSHVLSAFTEPYEPGSTLKPLLVAGLLAEDRVSLNDSVYAEGGVWRSEGRTFRDVHPYEWLTIRDALRVSSNVAVAKLVEDLPRGEQYEYLRDFGFGSPTGVEFPAESGGRLRRPGRWSAFSAASLAMGYEVSVTPLQLLMAYGALANQGVLMQPQLLREVRPSGEAPVTRAAKPLRRVVPSAAARAITKVLVAVVDSGTATRAGLDALQVAGKTGTARRTGGSGRYQYGSYTATFAGYFPAADPQLAILVKLDDPQGSYYGGLTAAPVTRETLQAILSAHVGSLEGHTLLTIGGEAPRPRPRSSTHPSSGREGPFVFELSEELPIAAPAGREPVAVPALEGLPIRQAVRRAHAAGLYVRLEGHGFVVRSVPAAGATLTQGDTLRLIGGRP